jgi:mono/diheme cytochrome c family protein
MTRLRRSGYGGQARKTRVVGAFALASVLFLAGCARGCTSSRPPIHPNPSMDDQPKVRPQAASTFFFNGASMREPVPGTVPIGGLKEDDAFFTGKGPDGQFVATIPQTVDDALVERGRQRYGIYCQPCHDARGDGQGILFQRGKVPTASFHDPKIVKYPDGQIFDVITNGQGLMSGYRWPIPPADRWAIIAYVRQLQRDRQARAAALGAPPAAVPAAPAAAPATPAAAPATPAAAAPATTPASAPAGTTPASKP